MIGNLQVRWVSSSGVCEVLSVITSLIFFGILFVGGTIIYACLKPF